MKEPLADSAALVALPARLLLPIVVVAVVVGTKQDDLVFRVIPPARLLVDEVVGVAKTEEPWPSVADDEIGNACYSQPPIRLLWSYCGCGYCCTSTGGIILAIASLPARCLLKKPQ